MIESPTVEEHDLLKCELACLEQLLEVEEQTIVEQSARLETILRDLQREREALRQSEERTRAIVDSALDAVITIDVQGAVVGWNPAAEKILGWSLPEALGRTLTSLIIPPQYHESHRRGLETYLKTGHGPVVNKRVELTALRRDGNEFPIEMSICPSGSGKEKIVSAFLRDITERRQAEQSARAREQAEMASRLKSEFLAVMSHEVRTPMNGVTGMVEILLSTDLTPEQQEYAQTIQSSADTLLTILDEILDFSKIEAGKLTLESIPFDLRRVVEETGHLLAPKAAQKGLDLIIDYAPGVLSIFTGDPGRMRQVLTNLTGNAIKFTAAGHVLIKVECEQQSGATARMRLSVEDTGIGIAEDKFETIFDKFTQADSSTTRKFGGTGLGLAISKRLAELMGGAVGVTSRVGQGSTFWFTSTLSRDARAAAPPGAPANLAGLRALIVDDNRANRRVLQEQLAWLGICVTCVGSGFEALSALRHANESKAPFHLALLDHQMPEMDGEALGRAIQADSTLRQTALVLLTSAAGWGDATRKLEAGFGSVLVKPVRQAQLMRALAAAGSSVSADLLSLGAMILPSSPQPSARPAPTPGKRMRRARVLVVDDNTVNQRVAAVLLEKLDCAVDLAANGKQAVEMVETVPYDLVFMDCQMPEMDGWEATAEIRRRQGTGRHTPIIALTASAMKDDHDRCLKAGMDEYMSKPMKSVDLRAALERWLASPLAEASQEE